MANIGQVTIGIMVSGGESLNLILPNSNLTQPALNAASPGVNVQVTLATGANPIAVPTGATYCVVLPSPVSVNAKTWNAASTVGGAIGTNAPSAMPIAAGASSVYIGSASAETINVYFI